ncbi:MAG: hypothetical protein Fur0021_38200 [Candidatus Promineifilaceae bacterium]
MFDLNRFEKISRPLALLLAACLLVLLVTPASAQDYLFSVPDLEMQVFVQRDASVLIVYDITFQNSKSGHVIDIVDIGMPTSNYEIGNMSASVSGVAVTDIRPSEFVNPGVEIHLERFSIPSGGTGALHFEFTIPNLVYQDVTNKDLASLQISPTWFDGQFVQGTTDIKIAIHLPEGVNPDEMLYQDVPFTQKALFEGRAVAFWEFPEARLTGPNRVGVSFSQTVMERVIEQSVFDLAINWFVGNPGVRMVAGIAGVLLFSFLFFRFSGGTGWSLWFLLTGGLILLYVISPGLHMLSFIPLIALIFVNERGLKKRKSKYLPPIVSVEGGGIKRGLTAAEAAALLEMPLNKVLALVLFGLLKKGVVRQVEATPLKLEISEPFRAALPPTKKEKQQARRQAAQDAGLVLHKYEHPFLEALEENPNKPVPQINFGKAMNALLETVAARLKGFNLEETRDYYRRIVDRAITEAKSIGDLPEFEKTVDRNLEWILMSEEYPTVFARPSYTYFPHWVRPTSSGGSVSLGGGKGSGSASVPSLGDVGAGFAGWAETTMGTLAGAILPGSVKTGGGYVNLSGVDKVTGDIFEALSSGSGGSGGSSGGSSCACACAGCACACACAGGGR